MYRSSKPSNKVSSSTLKPKVQQSDVLSIILPMINRMKVEAKSDKTITSYARAVERLVRFHDLIKPQEMEVDDVIDFLAHLQDVKRNNWRINKMYVAGLRYYWPIFWINKPLPIEYLIPKSNPAYLSY